MRFRSRSHFRFVAFVALALVATNPSRDAAERRSFPVQFIALARPIPALGGVHFLQSRSISQMARRPDGHAVVQLT